MEGFGARLWYGLVSVRGEVGEDNGARVVEGVIGVLGMTKAEGSLVSSYPEKGKGGVGYTRFQAITESFIAFDSWPALGGAYLVICSCKPFSIGKVVVFLRLAGLEVVNKRRGFIGIGG